MKKQSQKKPERNQLCPCGSGKKHKKCCGSPSTPARGLRAKDYGLTLVDARETMQTKARLEYIDIIRGLAR